MDGKRKRSDRDRLRLMAEETMRITKDGYYQKDGQRIYFLERDYKEAVVFDRNKLLNICEDKDGRLQELPVYDTEYILVEGDSFDFTGCRSRISDFVFINLTDCIN